jgi:cobyrinic acid a,c-diamide synthase
MVPSRVEPQSPSTTPQRRSIASPSLPAIVIAGTHSGVGKTSVTLGLIGALRRRGLTVQPFKIGPDFIDPLHHTHASGRTSRNLDGWMLDPETNLERFARATADADVAVVEGVMGLFDGSEGSSDRGSSAEMAKLLSLPVTLVVDAGAMARSAAALIHGFASFDSELRVAGVILNNVGGSAHAEMIREAVAGSVPVLGAIPRIPDLVVPERHLGLHLPHEARHDYVQTLASVVDAHVDIDALLEAGRTSRPTPPPATEPTPPGVRVGVARDEAFCFYYPENLELLRQAGAELVEFSPIRDPLPPGLDGLYIGGGYPELHAAELAANTAATNAVKDFCERGGPVYAECGGLMYLGQTLLLDGSAHELCGALPLSTQMPSGLSIGYVEVHTTGGPFGEGQTARGHLFHHSQITNEPGLDHCYTVRSARGDISDEGYSAGNVLASYIHLHFSSAPELPAAFVARCRLGAVGGVGTRRSIAASQRASGSR